MVRLTRIYTRGGDKGETSLGDGSRTAKDDLRVESFGTVDEANAAIGLARLHSQGAANAMLGLKGETVARDFWTDEKKSFGAAGICELLEPHAARLYEVIST